MADDIGTPGGGLAICCAKDQLGAGKRGQGHRHVLTVDILELGKGMNPGDDRAPEIARGLEALFE